MWGEGGGVKQEVGERGGGTGVGETLCSISLNLWLDFLAFVFFSLREGGTERERERERERVCVCVRVCVCERERDRGEEKRRVGRTWPK